MELNFDEIDLLQNSDTMKQKIREVLETLRKKGFKAKIEKIKPFSLWDMLYTDKTLRFNLCVSFPVHNK